MMLSSTTIRTQVRFVEANAKFDAGAYFIGKEKALIATRSPFHGIDKASGWVFLKTDVPLNVYATPSTTDSRNDPSAVTSLTGRWTFLVTRRPVEVDAVALSHGRR